MLRYVFLLVMTLCSYTLIGQGLDKPSKVLDGLSVEFENPSFLSIDRLLFPKKELLDFEDENYKVADAYRSLGLFKKSLPYYREFLRTTNSDFISIAYPLIKLHIGEALFLNNDMDASKKYLSEFVNEYVGQHQEVYTEKASRLLKSVAYSEINLLNKQVIQNTAIGASHREDILIGVEVNESNNTYTTYKFKKGTSPYTIIEERVLIEDSLEVAPKISVLDGIVIGGTYSKDSLRYYFANCNQGCNIYLKEYDGGRWTDPVLLDPLSISNKYQTVTPHVLTKNGADYIYYSSNQKGGKGGFDIYSIIRLPNGTFTESRNLGGAINSKGNELYPMTFENEIFVSSNGRVGFGGFDIYKSTALDNDMWTPLKNLNSNINTVNDEFKYYPLKAGDIFFSDKGEPHMEVSQLVNEENQINDDGVVFNGVLQNAFDKSFLTAATISIYETNLNSSSQRFVKRLYSDSEGAFSTLLPLNHIYKVVINKAGFVVSDFEVPTFNTKNGSVVNKKVTLEKQFPTLRGQVLDFTTRVSMKDVEIVIYELSFNGERTVLEKIKTDEEGKYESQVEGTGRYMVAALKEDYIHEIKELAAEFSTDEMILDFPVLELASLKPGSVIRMPKMQFFEGTSSLKDDSFFDLYQISELMRKHTGLNVAVYARPDKIKDAKDAYDGAYKKAFAVGEYLNLQKIAPDRIRVKGFDLNMFKDRPAAIGKDILLLIE